MNLTTTNYLFPTKEGRFQRWRRLSFCPPCGMGAAARCEGRCPSGAGRQTWLLLPEVGGLRPHAPHREGAPPHTPGVYAGLAAPAPTSGPTRPTPGVPFVSRRKEPKACRGCAPGPPEGGTLSPLRRCRTPPNRASATKIDRFATLSLWANRSCFFLWFHRGNTLCFQSVARRVGCPRGCLKV